jgi:uncharacterized protein (DUF3084 family)
MYGVLLIVVLVITGGAIAFIGDRLGSKIGKKRLSIFGLRPRHTSILITILTGICITTLTFGVMAAVSENVRTALFGMEKLNRTMQETQSRLQQAGFDLADAQQEQQKAAGELKKSQAEVDRLQTEQQTLTDRAQQLAAGNARLEEAKATLLEQNSGLTTENGRLAAGNEKLASANGQLTENNKQLEKRTTELRQGLETIREGDISFRAGEVIASGVIRGNRADDEVRADMGTLIQLANRNVAQRLGVNDESSSIWIYQPEYDKAAETIARSRSDMVVRIVAAGNLVRGEPVRTNLQLFQNSVIYKKNEFIIARPFKMTGSGNGEAEHVVMSFLQDVNAAATARGILPDPIRGSVGVMEGSQFYDLVQTLSPLNGTVLLSAYARTDTDALGPLRINLKLETDKTP